MYTLLTQFVSLTFFWFNPADGVQGWSCTRCWQALRLSGTGNRSWCCVWFWLGATTSPLQNGRTAQTLLKIWWAFFPLLLFWLGYIEILMSKFEIAVRFKSHKNEKEISVWLPQISRMLVVNPKQRYTASDALNHSFFSQYVVDEVRQFTPYRRFKVRCERFFLSD